MENKKKESVKKQQKQNNEQGAAVRKLPKQYEVMEAYYAA